MQKPKRRLWARFFTKIWECNVKILISSTVYKFLINIFFRRHQKSKLSLNKIGRNLMKKSNATLPKSPISCEEIIEAYKKEKVIKNYGTTLQNDENCDNLEPKPFFRYAHNAKSFSYVVFASENIIDGIVKHIDVDRRKFLLDATFKVCPFGPYNQLLVIYIEHMGEVNLKILLFFR